MNIKSKSILSKFNFKIDRQKYIIQTRSFKVNSKLGSLETIDTTPQT